MDFPNNDKDRFNNRKYYPLEEMTSIGKAICSPLLDNVSMNGYPYNHDYIVDAFPTNHCEYNEHILDVTTFIETA